LTFLCPGDLLSRRNFGTMYTFPRSVLEMPDCSYEKVYIGETRRMINTRMKEYQRDVRLKHITQSALSEHNMETGHQYCLTKRLQ